MMNHFNATDFDTNGAVGYHGPHQPNAELPLRRSLFNSELWHEVIDRTYGFKIHSLSRFGTLGTRQQFDYAEIDDFRGKRVISLPFSDFCDPLVDDAGVWRDLASELMDRGCPIRLKTVHNDLPKADTRFAKAVDELWHSTDLSPGPDKIWSSIKPVARSSIRLAQKSGVDVTIGSSLAEVMEFFEMHICVRRRKYRLLAQPEDFFRNIWSVFSGAGDLHVAIARIGGEPIAGTLYICSGDTLFYKFNASLRGDIRPNDLLVWSGILLGQKLGLRWLDFGISAIDQPGLVAFKRKYATAERQVTKLHWTPQHYSNPHGAETQTLLSGLTDLLTADHVPSDVTRQAGALLYRYFC